MLYRIPPAADPGQRASNSIFFAIAIGLLVLTSASASASAQTFRREIDTGEKVTLSIKSRSGRVSVITSDDQKKNVNIEASSAGAFIASGDIETEAKGGSVSIQVRDRRDKDRIDLVVHVPPRAKLKIEGEFGSVDVVGNFESAEVRTNTGTIHADVPLDAVKVDFVWSASRPRYLSEIELPEVKEKAGGMFRISGKLGEKKAKKD